MRGLKLNDVSKRGHSCCSKIYAVQWKKNVVMSLQGHRINVIAVDIVFVVDILFTRGRHEMATISALFAFINGHQLISLTISPVI